MKWEERYRGQIIEGLTSLLFGRVRIDSKGGEDPWMVLTQTCRVENISKGEIISLFPKRQPLGDGRWSAQPEVSGWSMDVLKICKHPEIINKIVDCVCTWGEESRDRIHSFVKSSTDTVIQREVWNHCSRGSKRKLSYRAEISGLPQRAFWSWRVSLLRKRSHFFPWVTKRFPLHPDPLTFCSWPLSHLNAASSLMELFFCANPK